MAKISIVVPCYNVEKYLDRCVESIVNQTLRDIEIILIDDESPDSVPDMCDVWCKRDSRIRVVHKKNGGLGYACNSGIEVATGEYIAFCDSDDWLDKDYCETIYRAAVENNVDAVFTGIRRVDNNGIATPMSQASEDKIFKGDELEGFKLDMIASSPEIGIERKRQMSAKIVLYSMRIIRKHNIRFHSERQYSSEDLLFNLDFLNHSKSVMELSATFYNYYINAGSISQSMRLDRFEKSKILRKYLITRYSNTIEPSQLCVRADRMFIGYVRSLLQLIQKCNLPEKNKLKLISEISHDRIWNDIAKRYPISVMPISHRVIFKLIQYRLDLFNYMLFRLII